MKGILKEILVTASEVDDFLFNYPREKHEESLFTTSQHQESLPTLIDTRWLSRVDSTLLANYPKIYDAVAEAETIHGQVFT